IIVENILLKDADITNITILSKDLDKQCSTNLSAPVKLLTGMIKLFEISCDIPCPDLGDVIVETTCGVKAKLSDIWKVNLARVLKCQ
ncbi:MAG: hypothetical protein GXN99_03330, partial [Candidatus Nanohaloarchaeota archaeon]|nr:hypothetical protein [Candidatus Nanohaloarchaeota archaeon]